MSAIKTSSGRPCEVLQGPAAHLEAITMPSWHGDSVGYVHAFILSRPNGVLNLSDDKCE